jgi:hypothetical protein
MPVRGNERGAEPVRQSQPAADSALLRLPSRREGTRLALTHQKRRSSCSSCSSSAFLPMNSSLLVDTHLCLPRSCSATSAGALTGTRRGPTLMSRIKELRTPSTISLAWSMVGESMCACAMLLRNSNHLSICCKASGVPCSLFLAGRDDRLQDNACYQDGRRREVERDKRLRFIQKTQVYAPVGEVDRGLQVLGYLLRQNVCGHGEPTSITQRPKCVRNW